MINLKKPLHIAVNTRLLINDQLEGIGRYTYELFSRISKAHPEVTFHFIFDRAPDPYFEFGENVVKHIVSPQVRHPLLAVLWFEYTLKKLLKKIKPDVFVSPDGMNALQQVCKTITVLHDINFVHYPEFFPNLLRNYYVSRTPVIARNSEKIVTVSEYSAQDISSTYQIDPGKIEVIYNSVGSYFEPLSTSAREETRNAYAEGCSYFVFVGGMYYRKNLLNQFKAFEIYKEQTGLETKMIYVGQVVKDAKVLTEYIQSSEYKEDVFILGRMEEPAMKKILGSALALTYVSALEGFGIPLVEAMMSGVPVITGNRTSMPEVCSDAALYAEPDNIEEIAGQMVKVASDMHLRADLIRNGLERAKAFSWDKSAEDLWKLIESIAHQ